VSVDVLIPWNDSRDPDRQAAFGYVCGHYLRNHPDWGLCVGTYRGEPWSKGSALRLAASQSSADVLVVADADVILEPTALSFVLERLPKDGWAVPHFDVFRLSREATSDLYAGSEADYQRAWRTHRGPPGGGVTIVTRAAWDTVGGVDPRFHGWGGEDICFGWALGVLAGNPFRARFPLTHLWHEPLAPRGELHHPRGSDESEALVERYRKAKNDVDEMRALVDEHKVSASPLRTRRA
jgi:hypothetical protein